MHRLLAVLALATLAACGARDFESRADRLVGGDQSDLVNAFGTPDASDSTGYYYYAMSDRSCAYKFTVSESGRVLGWHRRGENCGPAA